MTGSITLANDGALLDLNDNDFQYDYSGFSPYDTVAGWIRQARGSGAWDGSGGITSSSAAVQPAHATTIGMMEGFEFHSIFGAAAKFDGQDVFNSSLLLKYTYDGDANFDGKVDISDLGALATHWQSSAAWPGV